MSGPNFLAGLELWMAARTDTALREALLPSERRLGRELWKLFTETAGDDSAEVRVAYEALLVTLRGLALTGLLRERDERVDQILDLWLAQIQPHGNAATSR